MGDVFKALADPTRRAILDELAERDDQTLFELCGRLITKHDVASSRGQRSTTIGRCVISLSTGIAVRSSVKR